MANSEDGMLNKIIVGVATAVITAIVLYYLGFGPGPNPSPDPYQPPTPQNVSPQQEMGGWCCDVWGNRRCQLVSPVALGSSCFCPGQGSGSVCK